MTNSIIEDDMPDRWLEPEAYKTLIRLNYIKSIQSHIPNKCKECNSELAISEDEVYCPKCGLIHQASTDYHAGIHFHLPYGLRLG